MLTDKNMAKKKTFQSFLILTFFFFLNFSQHFYFCYSLLVFKWKEKKETIWNNTMLWERLCIRRVCDILRIIFQMIFLIYLIKYRLMIVLKYILG